MSVLVTGGAGYIGSHMVLELLDAGEKVVVIDNLSTGFRWAVDRRAVFVEGDIADNDLVKETIRSHGVSAIIHFAGSIVVPDSVADPLGYYLNNTVNSRGLIASAVETGVRNFIFSSTAAVYGNPEGEPRFGGCSACSNVALWLFEADDGNHAFRRVARPRFPLCRATLFQRRRC